ncbi:Gti1/Pac2 family-domain-containing protein [Mycena alexandri]|uniref:Gti1/Pac2 family-domain-containing protein n=1 Tax=Mycena alexandri TaxID=1745969 RepID=A0AAD6SZ89_9AGAR|nr:Gti1/Pac2 family-domain-containing protein [Mycena alexandri]
MAGDAVTHPALYIRNAGDVLVVLEAVRRGILPLITLRLSGSDRDQLTSGNVFVWEESIDEGGLVRWTDGRRWSQSKVCAESDCLLYQEKIEVTDEEREAKALRRAQRICNPGRIIPPPRRNKRPSKSGGLTKQTYSFLACIPESCQTRKWHVVAYMLWSDRTNLPVIEDYPVLRAVHVPVGVFCRSKASDIITTYLSANPAAEDGGGWCGERRQSARSVAPKFRVIAPSIPVASCEGPPMDDSTLPSFSPKKDDGKCLVLPPISWLKTTSRGGSSEHTERPSYLRNPIFREDRRILDSFPRHAGLF